MRIYRTLISFCLISFAACSAQSPQAADGPSMEQTVAFLADLYEKQGPLQVTQTFTQGSYSPLHYQLFGSISLEGSCSLAVKSWSRNDDVFSGNTTVVDLARSEPTSVSVKLYETNMQGVVAFPASYLLSIDHGYLDPRPAAEAIDDRPAEPLPPGTETSGFVHANSGSVILFVNKEGRLTSYTPEPKTKFQVYRDSSHHSSATIADVAPGDLITLTRKQVEIVKKPDHRTKGYAPVTVLQVADKDAATRMAKALIHALVLCHKDDKPVLF